MGGGGGRFKLRRVWVEGVVFFFICKIGVGGANRGMSNSISRFSTPSMKLRCKKKTQPQKKSIKIYKCIFSGRTRVESVPGEVKENLRTPFWNAQKVKLQLEMRQNARNPAKLHFCFTLITIFFRSHFRKIFRWKFENINIKILRQITSFGSCNEVAIASVKVFTIWMGHFSPISCWFSLE